MRKTIHETTRRGFVRAFWCDFVDRSCVIPETHETKLRHYYFLTELFTPA